MSKRFQISDKRQDREMPKIPLKDRNGVAIKECCRKTPNRRLGSSVESIDAVVIG